MNSYPNLSIVIPIGGEGKRFKDAGYTTWKPFININGKPMVQRVIENLGLIGRVLLVTPNVFKTQGATETVLLVKDQINNDNPLLIANCDQLFKNTKPLPSMAWDGLILTFKDTDPKWSFVEIKDGYVTRVAEKEPISDDATVGVYFWDKGSDFVKYAEQMIAKDIRVNGEFYNALVYNEAIADGKKIVAYQVDKMWGLGTPEDLEFYLNESK